MAGRVSYGDVESWVPEGDPVADVLMAGSVFMEPGAKDIDDAAWVLVVESLKKDEVEQRFKKELGKDGLGSDELNYLDEYNPAFEPENLASTGDSNSERVILFQCYERPTKKHAKGRLIFCTKGRKLRSDPLPKGEIRIVQITNIELVGERNGTSVVCQALPMQAEYNRTRSMGIEDKRLASRPQVLSPIGALDTDELDNEPGRVIEWDPGAAQGEKPEWFRGPGPSPILYQELQILSDEIDDLMSRHDPSMGAMRGATSGKHAERSQAADASRFSPAMWNVEDAITTWGRYLLSDIKENLKGERIVRITGDNHKADVVKFMATDISDDCHLEYSLVSQLEWSTEKLRQTVMWLHSVGLLDKNQALEMLKFPIKDGIYEGSYNHRINARKENEFLRSGMMFPPVGGDDHPIHIMEHLAELSQPEAREEIVQYYQENNGKWPQWVVAILTHAQQHQKAIPGEKPAPVRQSVSLRGELDPRAAMAIGQKAAGQTGPAGAGGQEEPQGLATPPGGMSGEMYMAPGPTQEPGGVGGMEGTPGGELQ